MPVILELERWRHKDQELKVIRVLSQSGQQETFSYDLKKMETAGQMW